MRGPTVVLSFAGLALAWVVLFSSGTQAVDRNATLLLLGATAFFYWLFRSGQTAPPLKIWHIAALIALPCYLLFQTISFPRAILETLSPARAVLTDSLAAAIPNVSGAPISIAPATSLFGFFGFLGYIACFLLIRDLSWRFTESRNWVAALPIIGLAGVEGLIGLTQGFSKANGSTITGTYLDRDHFSAFLEMSLPLCLVCGFLAFQRHRLVKGESIRPAIVVCAMWGTAILLFIIILESGSRAAPLVLSATILVTVALVALPYLRTKRIKWMAAGVLSAAIAGAVIVYPPDQFINILSDLAASDKSPSEQLSLWKETLPLISEFRWFGAGLGGFEPAFLKYQGTAASLRIDFAHNDYLNYLVELGIVGFAIFSIAVYGVVRSAVRGALFLEDPARRILAAAGVGCLVAIAIRSAVDSNLSTPANAFALAWVSGLISANGLE
jgi:O-antigen ligase